MKLKNSQTSSSIQNELEENNSELMMVSFTEVFNKLDDAIRIC